MNKMKLPVIFLFCSGYAYGQPGSNDIKKQMMDSIKSSYIDEAALRYSRIRQFSITHQQGFKGNISSKLYGNDFFKGNYQAARTTINMNIPVLDREKSNIILSVGVVHQFLSTSNIVNYNQQTLVEDTTNYIPMVSLGVSYVRRDTLLGHPVTISASLYGLFNPSFFRRQFAFSALATVPLVRTTKSSFSLGMLISIDPSSPVPFFVLASYMHRFQSLNMELMADLPYRIALRKNINKKLSLTAFGELAGNNSFFNLVNTQLPSHLTYSTFEVKSGLMFEYRLTKKAIISLSAGSLTTATSKVFEQGEKPSSYIIKSSNSTVPYIQVGFSLLPFWKGLRL